MTPLIFLAINSFLEIVYFLFSSSEPKAQRLAYSIPVEPASVRPSVRPPVCVFTLSNINISETNRSIATKFYLKHDALEPDWIKTLVSMATESSH